MARRVSHIHDLRFPEYGRWHLAMLALWQFGTQARASMRNSRSVCVITPRHPPSTAETGRISEQDVVVQIWVLLLAGLGISVALDRAAGHEAPIMLGLAVLGAFISYIYSAPPLKLKQNGWSGNYALGSSYIALPWWAGQVRTGYWCLGVLPSMPTFAARYMRHAPRPSILTSSHCSAHRRPG